jgi:UPF0755 protein
MNRIWKILIGFIIGCALLIGSVLTYFYFNVWKKPFFTDKRDKTLYIPTDGNYQGLVDSIAKWPILTDTTTFSLIARRKNLHNNIHPGRYIIPGQSNLNDFINILRSGAQTPVKVTFSNVYNLEELAGKIAKYIEEDSIRLLEEMRSSEHPWPDGITYKNNRAVFIPNTYELYWNTNAKEWVERMLVEYHKFWNVEHRAQAKSIKLTPHEVSILASIVEKETIKKDEMPKVAGLYINRLLDGWKLQSDPTVIFAIQQKDPAFQPRRVLFEDLKFDSPYNTYLYTGLPPGPIGFPTTSAIKAVLYAEQHNYYYMCANPDSPGYHSFAANDREHQQNRNKYIKWLQRQGIRR